MDAVQSPGKPLDGGVKQRLEGAFGKDLSDGRVHYDATAAGAAKSLEAAAFAVGTDIVFGEGRYAPGTDAGDHLIAHEVAHTVQNRAAGVTDAVSALEGATPSDVSTRGTGAEVEAHQAADTAMSGGAAAIHRSPDAVISKEDAPTASSNTRLLTNSDGETIGANTHKFFRKEGGVWNVVEVEETTGACGWRGLSRVRPGDGAPRRGAGPRDRPGPRRPRARGAWTAPARCGRRRSLKRNEAARRGRSGASAGRGGAENQVFARGQPRILALLAAPRRPRRGVSRGCGAAG